MPIRETTNFPMSSFEWSLLLALSLLWGGAFSLGQIALTELPPFTIVFCRSVIAAIALAAITAVSGQKIPIGRDAWLAFLTLGVLNNLLPFALLLWCQLRIGSGLASVLAATTPLFTVVVAHFFTADEEMTRARVVGVLIGLAGVAIAIGPAVPRASDNLMAGFAALGAAVCYAFAGVLGRRLRAMPPLPLATGQLAATSLLSLPAALLIEKPWTLALPGWSVLGAVLALALLSTALGYVLFFRLLSSAGAVNASLVSLLVPVTALLLAGTVLGEPLGWGVFAGLGLIFAGLAALNGQLLAR